MSNIEQDLILSHLPYPKYYNGYSWNTIINKSRKNIPQYLHEDLPKLKFAPIRQQFKKLNKIECPRLTYFNEKIIKEKIHSHSHIREVESIKKQKRQGTGQRKQRQKLKNIRNELQYALLTSDRDSNVIKKLLSKAQQIQQQLAIKNSKKRSHSVVAMPQREKCFQNTLAIVIKSRRQSLNNQTAEESFSSQIQKKVSSIRMLPFTE